MTATLRHAAHSDVEFNVDTEMKDVEIIHVTPACVLAKGRRFGRFWLLRGLPPEKRDDPESLSRLREEFDRRFSRRKPDAPLTVGMEGIDGLGICIVEEWRDDNPDPSILEEEGRAYDEEGKGHLTKHTHGMRRVSIVIAALIALACATGAGIYIHRLSVLSETARNDLETLRTANRESEKRMFRLADSLDRALHSPMIPEEFARRVEIREPDREERIARTLYEANMKEFERELERCDRCVIPQVIDDLPVYYDSIHALYRRMLAMGKDVDTYGRFPQLPEDDRIRLTMRLYSGYIMRLQPYIKVWSPKARDVDKMKKGEEVNGKEGHRK